MMAAHTPEAVHAEWMKAFNDGNLGGMVALYEPDSAVVSEPGGDVVSGLPALRENLEGYLSLGGQIDLRLQRCIRSSELAILYSGWTMNGQAPDGSKVSMKGQTSDVVRLQEDGTWLLAIDNPFGTEGIG
jgi:ketosteroid isomerase-like protein